MSALKRPGIWDKGPSVIQGEPSPEPNKPSTQVLENLSTGEPKNLNTQVPKNLSTEVLENLDTAISENPRTEEPKYSGTQVLENSDIEVLKNSNTQISKSSSTQELDNQGTKVLKYPSTQVLPKTQKNNRTKDEKKPVRKQASVHLSGSTLKALHLFAFEEGLEKSEVMEKALRKFIPKKYFE